MAKVADNTAVSACLLALALALAPGPVNSGRVLIMTVSELQRELPAASVLDAREAAVFEAGHVPGSREVNWQEWTAEKPGALRLLFGNPALWGKLPAADSALGARLRRLGLSNGRLVVVIGDPAGWGEEGRIAWNLLYWGASRVALLDGGFPAWRAARRPIETGPGSAAALGDFEVRPREERRIRLEALRSRLGLVRLLDARTPEEFAGKTMPGQSRGGHLPGATLVVARSLYGPDGGFVDAKALLAAGADDARELVTYCTGGVRSALLAVLIEARLGRIARNYDGSLWEWSADPALPLVVER